MRSDVLRTISDAKNVTNAIVLTHNVDFVFLQSMLLPAIRKCGQPRLTVFVDAGCGREAYGRQARLLDSIGVRYRAVQVQMATGFRFHPKAVLLSGTESATLIVGSGNLTYGGWRDNAEVWSRFDTATDGTGPFAAFREYMRDVLALVPLSESIQFEVDEAYDPGTRQWAANMDAPSTLLGRAGRGESLLDKMLSTSPSGRADRLVVCSPYFDEKLRALGELATRFQPGNIRVLAQEGRTGLTLASAALLPEGAGLRSVSFLRKGDDDNEYRSFIHAKFYAVETNDEVTVFAGSANCSQAALTIPGSGGNAELVAVRSMTSAEFERDLLGELEVESRAPELAEAPEEPPENDIDKVGVSLLAARLDGKRLSIAYAASEEFELGTCKIDGIDHDFEKTGDSLLLVRVAGMPTSVMVTGLIDGSPTESNRIWIDHERELRSTSRSRALADTIHQRVRESEWDLGAWGEIVSAFCKHLQYMPKLARRQKRTNGDSDADRAVHYTRSDVFAEGYGLPPLRRSLSTGGQSGYLGSLRSLLLSWFGFRPAEEEPDTSIREPTTAEDGDESERQDREEALPGKTTPTTKAEIGERDRKTARRLVQQATRAMTSAEFLENRPPEFLTADLKVCVVLLRTALREGWIDGEVFLASTHAIWSSLFFTSDQEATQGWLECRYHGAQEPADFAARMQSAELSAALALWALSLPEVVDTPEHARFRLASVLSVARLPWLWQGGTTEEIAAELELVLPLAYRHDELDEASFRTRWRTLIRQGEAMRLLEESMRGRELGEVMLEVDQDQVAAGELLWQGGCGFCVAARACSRSRDARTQVLVLQGEGQEKVFGASYIVPVAGLLNSLLQERSRHGQAAAKVARDLVDELSLGFAGS